MALAVYNPFRMIDSALSRDPMFRDFFREIERPQAQASVLLVPRMNVTENEKAYEVTLEVPGLKKEEIHLEVEGGRLAVWGEKKTETETKDKKYHVREISLGSFRRELVLPDEVDSGKIEAGYDHGHLKITLPKSAEKTARKISVS